MPIEGNEVTDIVQFPATAAKTLVEGYCSDFIQLAASFAQTLEQVSMRKLELGESRESLERVEKGMRDLADAIGALLAATEGPVARRSQRRTRDENTGESPSDVDQAAPAVQPEDAAQDAPQDRIGDRRPTRACIIQGSTDSMPMTSVFQFLSRMHKSGELLVVIDGEQLTFSVANGCVEAVRSTMTPAGERMGALMVTRGHVRPDQITAITKGKRCSTRHIASELLRTRQITMEQLQDTLRTQAILRIQRVMQAKRATYEFHEGRREFGPDPMRIRVPLQRPTLPSARRNSPQSP